MLSNGRLCESNGFKFRRVSVRQRVLVGDVFGGRLAREVIRFFVLSVSELVLAFEALMPSICLSQ